MLQFGHGCDAVEILLITLGTIRDFSASIRPRL